MYQEQIRPLLPIRSPHGVYGEVELAAPRVLDSPILHQKESLWFWEALVYGSCHPNRQCEAAQLDLIRFISSHLNLALMVVLPVALMLGPDA